MLLKYSETNQGIILYKGYGDWYGVKICYDRSLNNLTTNRLYKTFVNNVGIIYLESTPFVF